MRLVIGIGNTLRGDDGIGVAVAQHIAAQHSTPDLQVVTCQQLTPELIALISQAKQVIFVDASVTQPSGSVQAQPLDLDGARLLSVHHTAPSALLMAAKVLYNAQPPSTLVTIGGQDFGFTEQFSEPVAQALPRAAQLIMSLLETQSGKAH
ncbi:MAG: hydrogenase maturation protease [Anaerolineae bacterium]|nr:hydrogenase maturation protease [Anaerolineae bacterium]MDW8299326.1 hydrogenase maturation protease [Anaerolineae bacterium]